MNIKGKNKKLEKMKQKLFALKETVMTNITNKEDFKSESDISSVKDPNESIVGESKFHKEKERVNNLFDNREEEEYYNNLKKKILNRINSEKNEEEKKPAKKTAAKKTGAKKTAAKKTAKKAE